MVYVKIKDNRVVSTTKNKPTNMDGWIMVDGELPRRPPIAEGEDAYLIFIDGSLEWRKRLIDEPILTYGDYDNAMEDYLRKTREKRGYTMREPDGYVHSSNPRWSQDAKDWVAFRDVVMTYALDVINTYAKTGNAPTLKEFKAGFPTITWTYKEESR
jgi:hypothetical protein